MPKRLRNPTLELFPPRHERRRAYRIVPPDRIRCVLTGYVGALQPKDISASGIGIWTERRLPAGREYDLAITLDTLALSRRVRIVYCKRDGRQWLVGMTFLAEAEDDGKIDELIGLLASEFRAE